jgi:hypothetical protein
MVHITRSPASSVASMIHELYSERVTARKSKLMPLQQLQRGGARRWSLGERLMPKERLTPGDYFTRKLFNVQANRPTSGNQIADE